MGLEDDFRQMIRQAITGISPGVGAVDPREPRLEEADVEALTRVVAAQSEAIYRLAREIDRLSPSAGRGQHEC